MQLPIDDGLQKPKRVVSVSYNQVRALLLEGHSNKEIARKIGLKESTVKDHLTTVYLLDDVVNARQFLAKYLRAALSSNTEDLTPWRL